jgi:hypothetical protein
MGDDTGYRIAVAGVGLSLVALALAAGLGFVAGHDPPQAFWTVASGLSGGLLGLLVPTPTPASTAVAAAHNAAADEADQAKAKHIEVMQTSADPAAQAAAADSVAAAAREAAASRAQAARAGASGWRAFAGLLALFVAFEAILLLAPPDKDVASQLLELASAAAGAAIGLLGPSPATKA